MSEINHTGKILAGSVNYNTSTKKAGKKEESEKSGRKPAQPSDRVDLGSGKKDLNLLPAPPKQLKLPAPPTPEKELTVLFYMHGQYDDIGPQTAEALIDIERAGSDKNVNIVAQLGRNKYKPDEDEEFHVPIDNDWAGVRRYEVRHDPHKDLDVPLSDWLKLESEIPKNPILYYVIGNYYWDMGQKDKAMEYFDRSKKLGMIEYINNYDSESSKKIREEFNRVTRPMDEAIVDKKVFSSKLLKKMDPDVKMKDPATLKDFISWGMRKYPAKHYMVVIMGHGGAWMGAAQMSPEKMGDAIENGVKEANQKTGRDDKIDALVFNSCYMGSAEAAVEMKDAADISLVSENYATTGIFDEWSTLLGNIQKNLKDGKSFDARKFATDMVDYFRQKNLEVKENFPEFARWKRSYLTLSAIDNKKLDKMVKSWKKFNRTCKKFGVSDSQLFSEVKKAKNYPSGAYNPSQIFGFYDQIRDIGSIMDYVQKSENIPQPVKKAAKGVKDALYDAVIDEQHEGMGMEGSQGLTVWGPTNAIDVLLMKNGYDTDVPEFASKTGWSQRLQEAVNNVPKPIIGGFMKTLKNIREIKSKLRQEGISDEEKEKLEAQLQKERETALELKEKMDFTIERPKDIFQSEEEDVKLDMDEYGYIVDEYREEIPKKDGMKQK